MSIQKKISDTVRDVEDFPKKGIVFKDITPILKNADLCADIIDFFVSELPLNVSHVVGVESRGFLFGFPVSINKGIPFVLIRKKGKLPYNTVSLSYELEYGNAEIEMHIDSVGPGDKVVIHDDLLATGGTAIAAAKLIKNQGAEVVGFSFLVELTFLKGRDKLIEHSSNVMSIVKY